MYMVIICCIKSSLVYYYMKSLLISTQNEPSEFSSVVDNTKDNTFFVKWSLTKPIFISENLLTVEK